MARLGVALTNRVLLSGLVLLSAPLGAQTTPPGVRPPPIQDNSFLIEEAYNQERGVVQHISFFARESKTKSWSYNFTQEWPLRGQRHQLSFTVPLLRAHGSTGFGDIFLNYRFQLAGHEGGRVWLAPRMSAILPTGSWRSGRGFGVVGLDLRLPGSFELSSWSTLHLNGGITLYPRAHAVTGRVTLVDAVAAGSIVLAPLPSVNLLVESVLLNSADPVGPGTTTRSTSLQLSPGIRWAHNFRSGLQIVPGAAYSFGLTDASAPDAVILYLSFEHTFKRSAASSSGGTPASLGVSGPRP